MDIKYTELAANVAEFYKSKGQNRLRIANGEYKKLDISKLNDVAYVLVKFKRANQSTRKLFNELRELLGNDGYYEFFKQWLNLANADLA